MSGMRIEDSLARERSQIFEIIDDCVHQQRLAEAARRLEGFGAPNQDRLRLPSSIRALRDCEARCHL